MQLSELFTHFKIVITIDI